MARRTSLTFKTFAAFGAVFTIFVVVAGYLASRALEQQVTDNALDALQQLARSESEGIEHYFRGLESIGERSATTLSRWLSNPAPPPDVEYLSKNYGTLRGALRSLSQGPAADDISGVFLSNRSPVGDDIWSVIAATEGHFDTYAKAVIGTVFNMYLITKHQFIRIYPKDWALEIESDHDFTADVFYYIGDPEHNPSGKPVWTVPYYDSIWKHWMISLISPVSCQGEFQGIVGHDVILDDLYQTILTKRFFGTGYGFLFDRNGNVIVHPSHLDRLRESARMGTFLASKDLGQPGLTASIQKVLSRGPSHQAALTQSFQTETGVQYLAASPLGVLDWYYGVVVPSDTLFEMLPLFQRRLAAGAVVTLILLFATTALLLWRYVLRPIKALNGAVDAFRNGDFTHRAVCRSKDEIGQLASSFNGMAQWLGDTLAELRNDIHKRQQMESELRKSEEKYRSLVANVPVGLYSNTPGPEGRFVTANPAIVEMFGYDSIQEFLEIPVADLYANPAERERFSSKLQSTGSVQAEELQLCRKDGSHMWGQVTAKVVRDEQGRILFFDGMVRDVTELRSRQQERALLEEQLRQSQKMEAVGTLAGGIAHDFNNILSAVLGYTELVRDNLPNPSEDREYLEKVLSATQRAKELTRQILTFSRKDEVAHTPVEISPMVRESAELLKQTIPASVHLRFNIAPDAGTVVADPSQIQQIVMNLCTNAYHSLPNEVGVVEVSLEQVTGNKTNAVHLPSPAEGGYALLTVRDTGAGIDPGVLPRIFDPFFTTKERGRGTGLGLAVVHGIVYGHGGKLEVDSTLGKGTTIRAYLPLADQAHENLGEKNVTTAGGRERILYVDDEPMLASLGEIHLGSLGYEVHSTTSAREALEKFQAEPEKYDLLITDQTMPEMTGGSLAKAAMRIRPGFPVIICTGHSEVLDADRAHALGVRAFLMKPLNRKKLAAVVRSVLDEARK